MFKKDFSSEIMQNMEKALVKQASSAEDKQKNFEKIAKAAEYLNFIAEAFEEVDMDKEAEVATRLLESIASLKKK